MKPLIKILIALLFVLQTGYARAQSDKEKIEALRVSFISKKLDLTSSESEKFWPVYNEYNDKLKAVKKNLRKNYRQKSETLNDAEAEELYKLELQSKQAELELYKIYSERLKQIVGVKKMVKLHLAEEEFRQEVIGVLKGKNE